VLYYKCHWTDAKASSNRKMADKSPTIDNLHTKNGNFICGVVEGNSEVSLNDVVTIELFARSVKVWYPKSQETILETVRPVLFCIIRLYCILY